MFVVATAGHVDHGKSTLIRAMTGMDVDRLAEEKKRGMTIELNFAWFDSILGKIGIIDVPGHKKFVKNMVIGVDQVDAFIFVVAADDGWMPQSEEHLHVLQAFDIHQGIIVMTKTDLVPSTAEVKKKISDRFREAFGRTFQIFEFAKDATDVSFIKEGLLSELKTIPQASEHTMVRFWVDRSFSPKGLGLVVSGTLREGQIAANDKLAAWPFGDEVTVRAIESYQEKKDRVTPVSRVALQLSKASVRSIGRGSLLCHQVPVLINAMETRLRFFEKPVTKNTKMKFYHATLERECTVIPLKEGYRIKFNGKIPLRVGDKFLLRLFGGERTVACGSVLSFLGQRLKKTPVKEPVPQAIQLTDSHYLILEYFKKNRVPTELDEVIQKFPALNVKKISTELAKEKLLKPLKFPFFIDQKSFDTQTEQVVRMIRERGPLTTSDLKEGLSLSRKPAILLLEKMDEERITYLKDGVRRLLKTG